MTKKKRDPYATYNDEPSLTRQSFAEECDINNIVGTYTETGMINHIPRHEPQYGEAPDQTFFESACVNAELASQFEEGKLDDVEVSETDSPQETDQDSRDESGDELEKESTNEPQGDSEGSQEPSEGSHDG